MVGRTCKVAGDPRGTRGVTLRSSFRPRPWASSAGASYRCLVNSTIRQRQTFVSYCRSVLSCGSVAGDRCIDVSRLRVVRIASGPQTDSACRLSLAGKAITRGQEKTCIVKPAERRRVGHSHRAFDGMLQEDGEPHIGRRKGCLATCKKYRPLNQVRREGVFHSDNKHNIPPQLNVFLQPFHGASIRCERSKVCSSCLHQLLFQIRKIDVK